MASYTGSGTMRARLCFRLIFTMPANCLISLEATYACSFQGRFQPKSGMSWPRRLTGLRSGLQQQGFLCGKLEDVRRYVESGQTPKEAITALLKSRALSTVEPAVPFSRDCEEVVSFRTKQHRDWEKFRHFWTVEEPFLSHKQTPYASVFACLASGPNTNAAHTESVVRLDNPFEEES